MAELPKAYADAALAVARDIHRLAHVPPVHLEPTDLARYDRAQQRHVRSATAALEPLGFTVLGDVRPRHLDGTLRRPTVLRVLRDAAGTTTAGVFRVAPAVRHRVDELVARLAGTWSVVRAVELQTVLDDGSVVLTSATGPSTWRHPPAIRTEHLPAGTSPGVLVARHAQRVEALTRSPAAPRPVPVRDLADVAAHEELQHRAIAAFRRGLRYAADDELRAVLGKHHDRLGAAVRAHLEDLLALEEATADVDPAAPGTA